MKMTVTRAMFKNAFIVKGRANNFSSAGLSALFHYFEQVEEDIGEELELDVIAICCDYSESRYEEIADNYSLDLSGCENGRQEFDFVLDYLREQTMVTYYNALTGTILYQNF